MRVASQHCEEQKQPSFLKEVRYGPSRRSKALVVREEFEQSKPAAGTPSANGNGGKSYTVVSMFSGCGGMDLGFTGGFEVFGRRYRSLPFDILWANDTNGAACKTYWRSWG